MVKRKPQTKISLFVASYGKGKWKYQIRPPIGIEFSENVKSKSKTTDGHYVIYGNDKEERLIKMIKDVAEKIAKRRYTKSIVKGI